LSLLLATSAAAVSVAVFGDNATDDLINSTFGPGSATLVSDAQLATPGFLNAFDAVYITRDGASFGAGLSAAAATQVQTYVGTSGDVVLLVGDFADVLFSNPQIDLLTTNAVAFASASGHGYIGEFNGAAMGFAANTHGHLPLGFIQGSISGFMGCCQAEGDITFTQPAHPVASGLPGTISNPSNLEFGFTTTGVPNDNVIARYATTGDVAIAVRDGVPEPGSWALFSLGLVGIACFRRSRA
jgi:hypothetical protein